MHKRAIIFPGIFALILLGWFYRAQPEINSRDFDSNANKDAVQSAIENTTVNDGSINSSRISTSSSYTDEYAINNSDSNIVRNSLAQASASGMNNPSAILSGAADADNKLTTLSRRAAFQASSAAQGNNEQQDANTMQPEKTLEEKQHDWWIKYSRQVPQLLLHGTCPGPRGDQDLNALKKLADSGDKCAMGNYANAEHLRLTREYAPHDPEKMESLRQQLLPVLEYHALSARSYPLAAGARSCAAIIYFNDPEEAIAWQMINQAYFTRELYYRFGTCNSFLSPPDNEEAYQRALARALFYVDYYQLDK